MQRIFFASLIFIFYTCVLYAQERLFAFKYTDAAQFHYQATTREDILINGKIAGRSVFNNRISFRVSDVSADGNSALLHGEFLTTENAQNAGASPISTITDRAVSEFRRDQLGNFTVPEQYTLPNVRGIPTFLAKPIPLGGGWSAPALEIDDLSAVLQNKKLYTFPLQVNYQYQKDISDGGKNLALINASYTFSYTETNPPKTGIYAKRVTASSFQKIYWDAELGDIDHYEEEYKLIVETSDDRRIEFRNRTVAQIVTSPKMNKEDLGKDIKDSLKALPNVAVTTTDKGVMISIDNINFTADSSELLPSEKEKIKKIAELLKKYPDRDILISGHTALSGTAERRQELSVARAQSVANEIIKLGARTSAQIIAEGFGATKPLADNNSEAGRAKNRRVEITILEN